MQPIRIVWGTGRGPTALAAYDAALGEAGVHDYNLLRLSSVIPAGPSVEEVGSASALGRPEALGPPGEALHVVEASARGKSGPQSAVLAWARSPEGPGVFYEAGESAPIEEVREEAQTGIRAGIDLRERAYGEPRFRSVSIDADEEEREEGEGREVREEEEGREVREEEEGREVREEEEGREVREEGEEGEETYAAAVVLAVYGESESLV